MNYYIKINGRYLAKSGHIHGHPKTTLIKENARIYTSQQKATASGIKYFGKNGNFDITNE